MLPVRADVAPGHRVTRARQFRVCRRKVTVTLPICDSSQHCASVDALRISPGGSLPSAASLGPRARPAGRMIGPPA